MRAFGRTRPPWHDQVIGVKQRDVDLIAVPHSSEAHAQPKFRHTTRRARTVFPRTKQSHEGQKVVTSDHVLPVSNQVPETWRQKETTASKRRAAKLKSAAISSLGYSVGHEGRRALGLLEQGGEAVQRDLTGLRRRSPNVAMSP